MTQKAWPASDDFNVNWAPDPVWPNVRKPEAGDTPFVETVLGVDSAVFKVKLDGMAWPDEGGEETLTVRLKGTPGERASIILWQGHSSIAVQDAVLMEDFTDSILTLSAEQRAQITDYNDLHVSVAAATTIPTDTCPDGVSSIIYCLVFFAWDDPPKTSVFMPLVYDGSQYWVGTASCNGSETTVKLYTAYPYWAFKLYCNGVEQFAGTLVNFSCSPFYAQIETRQTLPDCCNKGQPGGLILELILFDRF